MDEVTFVNRSYSDFKGGRRGINEVGNIDLLLNVYKPLLSEYEYLTMKYKIQGFNNKEIGKLLHYSQDAVYKFYVSANNIINSNVDIDSV